MENKNEHGNPVPPRATCSGAGGQDTNDYVDLDNKCNTEDINANGQVHFIDEHAKKDTYDAVHANGIHNKNIDNGVTVQLSTDCQHTSGKIPEEVPGNKSLRTLDQRQRYILGAVCLLMFAEHMVVSMIGPLLPLTAREKGVSDFEVGLIFSMSWVAAFIGSLTFGKVCGIVSPKKVLFGAAIFMSVTAAALGFLQYAPNREVFLAIAFPLRIAETFLGYRGGGVAQYVVVATELPDHLQPCMAAMQASMALGFILSPPAAGGLYAAGGFLTPFLVMGGFMLLCTLVSFILMKDMKSEPSKKSGSYFPLLKQWRVILTAFHIMIVLAAFRYLEAYISLDTHDKHGWDQVDLAWLFSVVAVAFIISVGFWAILAKKIGPSNTMIPAGIVAMLGILLLGPAPFLKFTREPWMVFVFIGFYTIGFGGGLIPNVPDISLSARAIGYPEGFSTNSIVSAIYLATNDLGALFGPLVGGAVYEEYGFSWGIFLMAGLYFIIIALLSIRSFYEHKLKLKKSQKEAKSMAEYTQPVEEDGVVITHL